MTILLAVSACLLVCGLGAGWFYLMTRDPPDDFVGDAPQVRAIVTGMDKNAVITKLGQPPKVWHSETIAPTTKRQHDLEEQSSRLRAEDTYIETLLGGFPSDHETAAQKHAYARLMVVRNQEGKINPQRISEY